MCVFTHFIPSPPRRAILVVYNNFICIFYIVTERTKGRKEDVVQQIYTGKESILDDGGVVKVVVFEKSIHVL